nr:T9SS type A sorting domain-containing protein [Winogradskyella sp. SM1960]
MYPNPTKHSFQINFGINDNPDILTKISVYDIQGKQVKTIHRTAENIQTVNTSDFSSGIYILKINIENKTQSTHKLVIH